MKYDLVDELYVGNSGEQVLALSIEMPEPRNKDLQYLAVLEKEIMRAMLDLKDKVDANEAQDSNDDDIKGYTILMLGGANIDKVLEAFKKLVITNAKIELNNGKTEKMTNFLFEQLSIRDTKGLLNQYYKDFLLSSLLA